MLQPQQQLQPRRLWRPSHAEVRTRALPQNLAEEEEDEEEERHL